MSSRTAPGRVPVTVVGRGCAGTWRSWEHANGGRARHHRCPGVDVELGENPPQVCPDCPSADFQEVGDGFVGITFGDHANDFLFARAEVDGRFFLGNDSNQQTPNAIDFIFEEQVLISRLGADSGGGRWGGGGLGHETADELSSANGSSADRSRAARFCCHNNPFQALQVIDPGTRRIPSTRIATFVNRFEIA
jgi:hypothetical protein